MKKILKYKNNLFLVLDTPEVYEYELIRSKD